jgi:hypothetical protein
MSEAPRVEPPAEPEWVQRMRAAGYNIRIGTGEGTMSEIPDAYFYPPPSLRSRIRVRIVRACKRMVHALTSARRTSHAPFP